VILIGGISMLTYQLIEKPTMNRGRRPSVPADAAPNSASAGAVHISVHL
jgi:peptidoglycan/LPS O-acetylase OafA/YrhL